MWLYLKNGKVNFYDFLAQNTFDHNQKNGKKRFSNFFSIFENRVRNILGPQSIGQILKNSVNKIAQREVAMLPDERS